MNNNSLFCVCVDTVPVSQRVRSYNCEIHPKEPLVGKQAKNNPKEAAPAPKRFFGGGGVRGTSSVASGVMDSHFPVWGCCGGGGLFPSSPDPQPGLLGHLRHAPRVSGPVCPLLVAHGGLSTVRAPLRVPLLLWLLWDLGSISPAKGPDP